MRMERKKEMKLFIPFQRFVACLLVFAMVATSFTTAAFATTQGEGRGADYNAELLRLLTEEYGADQAPAMLETLQKLGLADTNGQLLNYSILLNGQVYTLEEMKQLLADVSVDLTQTAEVDGEPITLAALKEMIAIEERLSSLLPAGEEGGAGISPEHLDSLDSFLAQIEEDGGLNFVDENGNSLSEPTTSSQRMMSFANPANPAANYEDTVNVTVTKYVIVDKDPKITFQLNKAQNVAVSFDYEQIAGTQGSVPGPTNPTGTVTFSPGETTKEVTFATRTVNDSAIWSFSCRRMVGNPARPVDCTEAEKQPDQFRDQVWAGYARADYLHFHHFKNLDYMDFNFSNGTTKHFTHSYNGGAYLAFASKTGNDGGNGGIATIPNFFEYAMRNGVHSRYIGLNSILRASSTSGFYTTGQILPIQILFSQPVIHSSPSGYDFQPRLMLDNNLIAQPALVVPAVRQQYGWGAMSYRYDYQAVLDKSTVAAYRQTTQSGETYTGLNVKQSDGESAPNYYVISDDDYQHQEPTQYLQDRYGLMSWNKDYTNAPNIELDYARSDVFGSIALDKSSYLIGDTATVTVNLVTGDTQEDWLIDGATVPEEIAKRVKVSLGDRSVGVIDLDWKTGEDGLPISPPALEGKLQITQTIFDALTDADAATDGKQLRAKIFYNRNTTPGALAVGNAEDMGMLADRFAYLEVTTPKYISSAELSITYPATWPSGSPYVVNLIDATATKLGFAYPPNATYTTPDQFEWRSSDTRIAGITADGTILPKTAGTVTFTLAAKNNGEAAEATVTSQTITISADGSAAVVVPSFANRVYVNKNKDANILWSTNVMDRYKELAGAGGTVQDANFKLELYDGFWDEAQLAAQQPTQSWEAPTAAELINATSFKIPGSYMKDISSSNVPSYTVRIGTVNPENAQSTLSALSYIVVRSEAATVTLNKSMGQFVVDSVGTLPIRWTLDHFDPVNRGEFEFQITKNGVLIPDSRIVFDRTTGQFSDGNVTATGGSYSFNIAPVTGSRQIKDVYAITLAVKNSTDATWSYDSLYLQVYKNDAVQIQIDGQPAASYKMTNVDRIKQMTSDQIIALKRNILLNNELGVNNKDYDDLGEITDQIAWKSSNNDVGTIYHRSDGYVEDIEKFNNSSYQPKQKFLLGGTNDGRTTITATHARTGMKAELDLTVETLKDKLYLFQLYPKTETTLTYTNGAGAEKSVKSDANGQLALYDESGIASDAYVTSVFDGSTYTGVFSQDRLLSQEGNPAQLELYPINILQLRQLSKVELFFKKPDGKPYTGKVTYRGGVYKNGNYAEATEIGGSGITETLAADGKLEIIFDTTDFYSVAAGEKNAADLSAKDKLEFIVETRFEGDRYNPSLVALNGDASPIDRILIGDKIVNMIGNDRQQPTPVIVNQFVASSDKGVKTDIRDYRGKYGPNNAYPSIQLTTELLWWGEEADQEAYAVLENSTGLAPQGQSYQTLKYPFSDLWLTRHVQVLNKDTIWLDKAQSGSVHFKLYDKPDSFRKSFTSTATLVNMIGASEVSAAELRSGLQKLKSDMNGTNGSTKGPSNNDKVVLETLSLLGNLKMDVGPLAMRVYPTDDPMVFKMIMSASLDKMASTQGSSDVQFMKSNNNFAPGAGDLYKIAMGQYVADQKNQLAKSIAGHSGKNIPFSAGGYYIGEIKYNVMTDAWEAVVHGGGFNAGGGFEYSWSWNVQAGFIPVTFSLTIGGGLEVGFRASVLFDEVPGNPWSNPQLESVNDYLTSLRVLAYIEAFGGIGFDYSIIAAKIGVFGKITLENTSTWLNRNYLQNSSDRVLYGNKLTLESIVGIRVVIKFLFISIQHDFASLRYSHTWLSKNWDNIQDYWKEHATMPLMASNAEVAILAYMRSIGEDPMQVFNSQTVEDRSYLDEYDRSWRQAPSSAGRSLLAGAPGGPQVLESNAYPYSNPQVAADGSLFVYLSDNNSANVEDTAAAWAVRNGQGGYDPRGEIVTEAALEGYGDTGLQLDGEGNLVAAVWVRQKDKIGKEAGEELTGADMLLMNNSAEIMVAVYDGTNWVTKRLTDNQNPDIAPIVSVGGGKVVVAYRSVYSSNIDNPLDFSESDSIVYTVYDTVSGVWSDVETLYNGTNGTVMGMSAETLTDGTTAVVYTVNNGNTDSIPADQYVAGTDNEIVYAVIDTSADPAAPTSGWKTKGVVKNLQVTYDRNANENPQLTSVIFPDGTERFVMAWYTTSGEDESAAEDIRMLAFNRDGEVYSEFVDSLSAVKAYNNVRIHPNFVFAKMPQADRKLEHLSLIWKEAQVETVSGDTISRDALKAVKLGLSGGELYLSGVMELGAMPDDTAIDTIAAYVANSAGTEIRALLLGTTYTTDTEVVGSITPKQEGQAGGDAIPVTVSKTVSAMYTASATYHNQFNADQVVYNPGEIVAGYDLPIQFNVVNQGLSAIQSVDITINGAQTNYADLSLVPNSAQGLIAYYTVPSPIADAAYQIEVVFADGERQSTAGTLRLDVPDTGISKIKVMKEEAGKRVLSIPVYNKNGTTSSGKGRVVKLALYEGNQFTDDTRIGNVIAISDADALSLIDQGAYVETVEFDVRAYLIRHGLTEIPDNGITIYLHSWAEDAQGQPLKEFDDSDNEAKVTLDNLALKYNENQVLLTMEQTNTASRTSVDLTMQNMKMAPITSGNVLLNLLDAEGQVLETKYVATDAAGLLSFSAEEKKTTTVQFSQAGHSVQGVFFRESADVLDATLSTVKLSGVPLDFDPGQTAYALQASDLKRTQLVAAASNSEATVSLLDGSGKPIRSGKGFVSVDQTLQLSASGAVNEFKISVQPASASGTATTYRFSVTNTQSSRPQLELKVKGTAGSDGKYAGNVEVALSPYVVDGFKIDKAMYKVNDESWSPIAYDGNTEQKLTTLSKEGSYKVAAKVVLASGLEYEVDAAGFAIGGSTTPNPDPGTGPGSGSGNEGGNGSNGGKNPGTSPETPSEPKPDPDATSIFNKGLIQWEQMLQAIKERLASADPNQTAFADTATHWARQTIDKLARLKVLIGYSDGSFKPSKSIMRAEFASVIARLFVFTPAPSDATVIFADLNGHWAEANIADLAKHGIVTGYGDGSFRPDATITREEMIVMMMRLVNEAALPQTGRASFTDMTDAGKFARQSIDAAAQAGLVQGYDGKLLPKGKATRAETVTMLWKLLTLDPELKTILEQ